MRQVYLDYSATTPIKEEVLNEMMPFLKNNFGNPSSVYSIGLESKEAISLARSRVAKLIGAKDAEITFTSCGSESDNWALMGVCDANQKKGKHIITSKIEHHAILHTADYLEKHGYEVTYLDVQADGRVNPEDLKKAMRPDTILVSIMLINNEVGTIQPIKELAKIAHDGGAIFHTDAVQALGNVAIDVNDLGVDLMSMSGHKIYAPKGVGAMYIKRGTKISNYLYGGAQESKKRAGTENLTSIVGFGKAAEIAMNNLESHRAHLIDLRDYFIDRVLKEIDHTYLNGHPTLRHPGNANITFEFIEGEGILLLLDQFGIQVSTGSACNSSSLSPSHVLSALGIPVERIHGSVRFTFGDFTTKEDVDYVIEHLKEIVSKLREISSVNEKKGW